MLVENPQAGLKATLAWQVIGSDTVSDTVATRWWRAAVKNTPLRISLVQVLDALKKPRHWPSATVAGVIFAKKVTLPARPFLGLSADDEGDLRNILADYLRAGLS